MPSTFKSLGLFNSGPHRFHLRAVGEFVVPNAAVNPTQPGSQAYGPLELFVIVTGRLVAASESALWTLRDAVAAQLTHPPQVGTLIDHHGRTWTDMSFVRFEQRDDKPPRTDRARVKSLAYTASFMKFL